jgi:hypothetical protein
MRAAPPSTYFVAAAATLVWRAGGVAGGLAALPNGRQHSVEHERRCLLPRKRVDAPVGGIQVRCILAGQQLLQMDVMH